LSRQIAWRAYNQIHVVVDAQGLPIRLGLTAGQTHDGQIVDTLLDRLDRRTIVLADKAYDAARIRELIQYQGATPNIPPKNNRRWKPCFSKRLYRERNLIERFFSKLKHFRRVATRYDKLAHLHRARHRITDIPRRQGYQPSRAFKRENRNEIPKNRNLDFVETQMNEIVRNNASVVRCSLRSLADTRATHLQHGTSNPSTILPQKRFPKP
jgi:transposase